MYYEEKVINGILFHRSTPQGEWHPFTTEKLTKRLMDLQAHFNRLANKCETMERELKQLADKTITA